MKINGVIAAVIIAIIYLYLADLPFPADAPVDSASVGLAMKIGVFFGAVISGLLLVNFYVPGFSAAEKFAEHQKGARMGCLIGGLASLPVGFVFGISFGGTLGAGIGSLIGGPFIPFGVGLLTMVVVILISTIAALLGSLIGNFAEGLVKRG